MTDAATRLATRLERVDNHLVIVLSIHLFVEQLLDPLIGVKSEIAGRILKDHRTYTFSVSSRWSSTCASSTGVCSTTSSP